MERRCWINFQCLGVLLICMIVGQGPTVLAVGAGGGCLDIFTHISFPLSLSLWETARYRLKYCLKGPLSPKQPTKKSYIRLFQICAERADNVGRLQKITKQHYVLFVTIKLAQFPYRVLCSAGYLKY